MTEPSLNLPLFDDREFPAPRLTPEQRAQRMAERAIRTAEAERASGSRGETQDLMTVPFVLLDD